MNENSMPCTKSKLAEWEQNIRTIKASEDFDNHSDRSKKCEILKSGPLLVSSKGIGWPSWKKRWFVLSRKSFQFYRVDPNTLPQKGSEAPALGGITLNNSGSVVVKTDKKLLTILSPGARNGKAFSVKTETLDELNDWKAAIEGALAQAPGDTNVMAQNEIILNEGADSIEASDEQLKDRPRTSSSIIGRSVLLALEEIDGSPSFLEKAFRFIEEHGVKVEGILRQSADVEEVLRRIQEYEQGKTEFAPDEDAHVIGDCIKYVLREMPSSPVPASCCTALVHAYRTHSGSRVENIRDAIYETFPVPNRHLLQRILQMILVVAAHKAENRMGLSALAACMAPLLLCPLLAGECEISNDFQTDHDGSFQLLQAAAAANHAQAIVIILLDEYENIFQDESFSSELYTESEDEDIEDDESTSNDISNEDWHLEAENDQNAVAGVDIDCSYSETPSGSNNDAGGKDGSDLVSDVGCEVGSDVDSDIGNDAGSDKCYDFGNNVRSNASCNVYNKGGSVVRGDAGSDIGSNFSRNQDIKENCARAIFSRNNEVFENTTINSNQVSAFLHEDIYPKTSTFAHVRFATDVRSFDTADIQNNDDLLSENNSSTIPLYHESHVPAVGILSSTTIRNKLVNIKTSASSIVNLAEQSKEAQPAVRNKWGRTSARKNLSVESIEYISDDESAVQRLETTKIGLQIKLSEEIKGNAVLQLSLDERKQALLERRLALETEVVRLKELLQKERDLKPLLESDLMSIQPNQLSLSTCSDSKIMSDLEDIALSVRDINNLKQNLIDLTEQLQQGHTTFCQSYDQPIYTRNEIQQNADDNFNEHKKDDSSIYDEGQGYQSILPEILNQSVGRYSEASLSEDQHRALKKLSRWEGKKRML
ncbi:rho GTPase-activating protein 6-like isoform X2 [Phalaenopsis equestris]|nr:rho GTPase-activating protein 6-like isoform X2 [Phalaenopsis equestris]